MYRPMMIELLVSSSHVDCFLNVQGRKAQKPKLDSTVYMLRHIERTHAKKINTTGSGDQERSVRA